MSGPAHALREGYSSADLKADLMAGAVVGIVALPLSTLRTVERRGVQVVVLDLEHVPALDATGLVNLESLVARLNEASIKVILVGVQGQPLRALARAGWRNRKGRLRIFRSFERGLALARRSLPSGPPPVTPA